MSASGTTSSAREARAERDDRGGRAGEVQVVQRAEHAAGHEHDGGEQHRHVVAVAARIRPRRVNRKRDHRGGEHLEEAFDPQVHHPPAPVLDHRRCACARPTSGRRRRTGRCATVDRNSRPTIDSNLVAPAHDRRPQRAADQGQPQQQADEQEDLPEAADVDVFPALVAEPEVVLQAQLLHHREPLAGERADHDDQQAGEQEVHAQALELRLMPGDRRRDVQAGAQPRGGDPQHRELRVPGARQRIGQDVGQREAVGLLAFDLVVRGDRARAGSAPGTAPAPPRSTSRWRASTGVMRSSASGSLAGSAAAGAFAVADARGASPAGRCRRSGTGR